MRRTIIVGAIAVVAFAAAAAALRDAAGRWGTVSGSRPEPGAPAAAVVAPIPEGPLPGDLNDIGIYAVPGTDVIDATPAPARPKIARGQTVQSETKVRIRITGDGGSFSSTQRATSRGRTR